MASIVDLSELYSPEAIFAVLRHVTQLARGKVSDQASNRAAMDQLRRQYGRDGIVAITQSLVKCVNVEKAFFDRVEATLGPLPPPPPSVPMI